MGVSKSKSSSTQYAIDKRVAVETGNALVADAGSSISYTSVYKDLSADVAKSAICGMERVTSDVAQEMANVSKATIQGNMANTQANSELIAAALAGNSEILAAVSELGSTTATGGQSDMNKTLLGLGVAGALAVAAVMIFRR